MRCSRPNGAESIKAQNRCQDSAVQQFEIIKDYRSDTFRAVYTVRFAGAVYVLHAFQKKSKTGRKTPKSDIELVRRRLRDAERIALQRSEEEGTA
jgi:phage-related protein